MIHKLLANRRSTVLFSSKSIDSNTVNTLFEAARWAPSSMNQQPWRFIYALRGDTYYSDLLSCISPKNQKWAKNAPLLLCTIAQTISDYNDRENIYAWHDTAMAYANLVVQATSLGLSAHPMAGFDREKSKQFLEIPERYEPVTFAAIGFKSSSQEFPGDLIDRENNSRTRKEIQEFVFHGRFMRKVGI